MRVLSHAAALFSWFEFALCAAVIAVAGSQLPRYGEAVARLTGLSRSWVGLVLLATATSLPELFTGISAVTVATSEHRCRRCARQLVFNLLLLVLLDELSRKEPMYRRIDQGHILTAGFGVIMIGSVGALILLGREPLAAAFLHVSAYTPLIVIVYFVAMRAAFDYERRAGHASLRRAPAGPGSPSPDGAVALHGGGGPDGGRRELAALHRPGDRAAMGGSRPSSERC